MDAQSYTAQERRAANQDWAAAGAYGFEPVFLARYTDGTTDFYMNTVVGLIHKYYGDALIRSVFDAWDGDLRQTMLDDMTWLYLENAAYRLELPRRPVLEALRHAHADYFFAIQYKLSRQEWMAKNQLVYTMQAARWRRVLGRADPVMTPYESGLAAALALRGEPDAVSGALALALGIGLQNIPEGAAVSLPLAQEGRSKRRAFAAGAASGLVEPLGGLLALALAGWVSAALPWLMSLAAGCMVCVTAQEMIPEAVEADEPAGVISVVAGVALMMALDVAL